MEAARTQQGLVMSGTAMDSLYTMTFASDNSQSKHDEEGIRRAVRRAMRTAQWIWPTFLVLDTFMATVRYPGVPVWRFIAMRLIQQALIIWVHRLSCRPDFPARTLLA